jgi:hypothetical protein
MYGDHIHRMGGIFRKITVHAAEAKREMFFSKLALPISQILLFSIQETTMIHCTTVSFF